MKEVFFSLGSNLGDRQAHLEEALRRLDLAFGRGHSRLSRFLETEAWGFEGRKFLNCAVMYELDTNPEEILDICKSIERAMGREDPPEYGADGERIYHDRVIDIDILLYGDEKISTGRLTIPHPRMYERAFVMVPLAEIINKRKNMTQDELFKVLVAHCKEYGFIFPSSEIYDGLAAVYDYGQMGVELKNNIKSYWWNAMTRLNENIVGIDSCIFMHPRIWEASGHVSAFNDPLIDNKDSKKRYRADVLIEDYLAKIEEKIDKEVAKGRKRFGDSFDEAQFRATNPNVLREQAKYDEVHGRFLKAEQASDFAEYRQIIIDCGIVCPISGTCNWTEVRQFNLMFSTSIGSTADSSNIIYLRPETAQGIFVNYLNVQKTGRMKIPFGIAQIGKAFRNEIVARQFIFRMREFEQMEMQFFIKPGTELDWFAKWKENRMKWHVNLGMGAENYRFHDHEKLAHYANAATDIEFNFPFGFKELEGIHSRTNFDLGNHQKFSGKKIEYFDPEENAAYTPYVVETSIGVDRMVLAVLSHSLHEEQLENGETRIVMSIPAPLAPVKAAVLPLVKKDGLPELAQEIMNDLKYDFNCQYEEKDSIGKRYRRQDAIGTPFCITVDHDSLQDHCVTVRDRDTMQQQRVPIAGLRALIDAKVNMNNLLRNL